MNEVSSAEALDTSALEDFDVPCEYSGARYVIGHSEVATWAHWLKPRPCGCESPDYVTMCDACHQHTTTNGLFVCRFCWHIYLSRLWRAERFR